MLARTIVKALALATTLLVAAAAFTGLTARANPSKGDPALGKKTFKAKACFSCHMVDGHGGFKVTGNPTPNWRDVKRMSDPRYNDDYLRDCITNGKIKSGMVAWSKQGTKPAEIENLIAYIRTFSGTKSASARRDTTAKPDTSAKADSSKNTDGSR